jgi:hypothetical protein
MMSEKSRPRRPLRPTGRHSSTWASIWTVISLGAGELLEFCDRSHLPVDDRSDIVAGGCLMMVLLRGRTDHGGAD